MLALACILPRSFHVVLPAEKTPISIEFSELEVICENCLSEANNKQDLNDYNQILLHISTKGVGIQTPTYFVISHSLLQQGLNSKAPYATLAEVESAALQNPDDAERVVIINVIGKERVRILKKISDYICMICICDQDSSWYLPVDIKNNLSNIPKFLWDRGYLDAHNLALKIRDLCISLFPEKTGAFVQSLQKECEKVNLNYALELSWQLPRRIHVDTDFKCKLLDSPSALSRLEILYEYLKSKKSHS